MNKTEVSVFEKKNLELNRSTVEYSKLIKMSRTIKYNTTCTQDRYKSDKTIYEEEQT